MGMALKYIWSQVERKMNRRINFTSEKFTGFVLSHIQECDFTLLIQELADNAINIRGLIVDKMKNGMIFAVIVPGDSAQQDNSVVARKTWNIISQLCICASITTWVVVDNQPIAGQFNIIWNRIRCHIDEAYFGLDESQRLGIATDEPDLVQRLLLSG
jgi:hypothetical protein